MAYPVMPWRRAAALRGNPGPVRARLPALVALEEFRGRLHKCLTARADALFDLADAVLCSDHVVRSLVQLSLEPEFRRGHGALYDALAAGRVMTSGCSACSRRRCRRWWSGRGPRVDRGSRRHRPRDAGPRAGRAGKSQAAQVRDACAPGPGCGSRSTRPPIPGRTRSTPRAGSASTTAPATAGASKTTPGWEYQLWPDAQDERGGVVAGERVHDVNGPARQSRAGLVFRVSRGCSVCRGDLGDGALAEAWSTRFLQAPAVAIRAAVADVVDGAGLAAGGLVDLGDRVVGEQLGGPSGLFEVVAEVGPLPRGSCPSSGSGR